MSGLRNYAQHPGGGALPSEKVEQSADGWEQAPPRREHRMDDAAARLPLWQDMDKTPGPDIFHVIRGRI
jgi:hypothetical protein